MQHRMMKEAQRAMAPWMGGQPVYGPISHASTQMNPLLYSGMYTFFNVVWSFISSRCQSSFCQCVRYFQDLLQEKAFHWKPCRSHLLSPPPTACPLPAPMVTSLLPTTITCLITWRARWGGWTWRVLFSRYVQPALLTYLGFILASQDLYFSTTEYCLLPVFVSIRSRHLHQTTCSRSHLLTNICLLPSHFPPVLPVWSLPSMMPP